MDYLSTNVMGTVRVLECARHAGVRKFVYAASSSCYGLAAVPTREDAPIACEHPYALSKYKGEEAVLHWSRAYKLPVNSIRIFNAYGTRSKTSGAYGAVFGVFLAQKLAGKPFTVVGDGTQTRDFTFVSDVVSAFISAAKSDISGVSMNVGSGHTYSVNRLIELLGGDKIYIPKRPGEPDCTFADMSRIKELLHWSPRVSLEDGVGIMLRNIDYWREAPVWNPETIAVATEDWFKYLK